MAEPKTAATETEISSERFAELLNEDLSREYQAINVNSGLQGRSQGKRR